MWWVNIPRSGQMTSIFRCGRAWSMSDCFRGPRRWTERKLQNSRHLDARHVPGSVEGRFPRLSGACPVAGVSIKSGGFPRLSVLESDDGSGIGSLRDAVGCAGGYLGLSSTAESSPPLSEKWHLLAPPSHPMRCPRDEGSSVEHAAVMCQPANPGQKTRAIDGFFF